MKIAAIDENDSDLALYFDLVKNYGEVKLFNNPSDFKGDFDFVICDHRFESGEDWTDVLKRIDDKTQLFVISNFDIKEYKDEFDVYLNMRAIDRFENAYHIRKDNLDEIKDRLELKLFRHETLREFKKTLSPL